MKSDLYDFRARLVVETEKAWILDVGLEENVSIPKSVGEFDGQILTIPEKWVEDKGMESLV